MSEWKEYILEDIIEKFIDYRGKTPNKTTNGVPLVTAKIVKNGSILPPNEFITVEDYDKWMTRGLPEINDIVLTTEAPLGEIALIKDKNVALAQRLITLRGKKDIVDNPFLKYYFQNKDGQHELQSRASGTTVFGIKAAVLKKVPIYLPPLPEQRAIASVLSSLDDKIDLLHRQNKTLKAMAETLFRQWFVEEADEGWEECTLNDLCTQIASGGTPSTKIESYYNGDINWYSTKELKDNFLYESENKITKEGLENSSAKLFPAGTVVIAIYAAPTVGRLGILANEASFNQAACGHIANEELCCSEFIYLYLKNQRDELNLMASGSAQQNLNVGKIKSFPAFKVQKDLMNKFKDAIQPNFKKINSNTLQISTLEKLRDTLLPKLMSAEVGVKYER